MACVTSSCRQSTGQSLSLKSCMWQATKMLTAGRFMLPVMLTVSRRILGEFGLTLIPLKHRSCLGSSFKRPLYRELCTIIRFGLKRPNESSYLPITNCFDYHCPIYPSLIALITIVLLLLPTLLPCLLHTCGFFHTLHWWAVGGVFIVYLVG